MRAPYFVGKGQLHVWSYGQVGVGVGVCVCGGGIHVKKSQLLSSTTLNSNFEDHVFLHVSTHSVAAQAALWSSPSCCKQLGTLGGQKHSASRLLLSTSPPEPEWMLCLQHSATVDTAFKLKITYYQKLYSTLGTVLAFKSRINWILNQFWIESWPQESECTPTLRQLCTRTRFVWSKDSDACELLPPQPFFSPSVEGNFLRLQCLSLCPTRSRA